MKRMDDLSTHEIALDIANTMKLFSNYRVPTTGDIANTVKIVYERNLHKIHIAKMREIIATELARA